MIGMKRENIKTILLTVLVVISLVFTWGYGRSSQTFLKAHPQQSLLFV